MSLSRRLKSVYLAYFSKPVAERCLYRAIRRHRVRSIVEVGIGDLQRAVRLIDVAAQGAGRTAEISYTGIDMFDARPDTLETMKLKAAHQRLCGTGARIKLVPGDAHEALARTANSLGGTDLVLIGAGQAPDALARAWFYVPRMLHVGSVVFLQQAGAAQHTGSDPVMPQTDDVSLQCLQREEINRFAELASRRRAA